jgi:hypothetical protein
MHIKEHPPLQDPLSAAFGLGTYTLRLGFVALHLSKTERRTLRAAAAIAERARAAVAGATGADVRSLDTELDYELARLEFAAEEIAAEEFFHIKDNEEDQ